MQITTATPWGVDARGVQVEVDVYDGLPQMQIVGLPDAWVHESRERVRSAIKNSGFALPRRAVVNLETIRYRNLDRRSGGGHPR